ncbi:MAG: NADPH:quinone reductase [Nitrospinae bacterium]|nr:NADPH:quinone reductase [Nitrospinota bacterium]
MKAVRVTRFGLDYPMELEEVVEPAPGPGEMLVRIAAAGVNPLEVAIRSGNHPRAGAMTLPYTCGTDVAGEVEAVGEGVEAFAPGDRVWGRASTGAYAEKGLLPAGSTGRLPGSMTFAEGAALPIPLLTAWNALVVKGEAAPGDCVLVQGGAGGVGYLAIQLARAIGCRVFTTVSSKEKANFCLAAGAEAAVNYREEDVPGRVMELTSGRGVEVVVENIGCDNLSSDLKLNAVNGRIVIVGTGTGKGPEVTIPLPAAMGRDARILALSSGNLNPLVPGILRRLAPLLEGGAIKPHIGRELPMEQANESHEILLSGKFLGKINLVP